MKTIKELKDDLKVAKAIENKEWIQILEIQLSQIEQLKDVMGLIDDGIKCPCIIRLKARIVG